VTVLVDESRLNARIAGEAAQDLGGQRRTVFDFTLSRCGRERCGSDVHDDGCAISVVLSSESLGSDLNERARGARFIVLVYPMLIILVPRVR